MSPAEIVQVAILSGCALTAVFITVLAYRTWRGNKFLCDDCKYNDPQSCQKTERPHAVDCAAYVRKEQK